MTYNAQQLRELYDEGRLDTTAVLQQVAPDLEREVGVNIPRRPADLEEWWPNNKAVVSRKLP